MDNSYVYGNFRIGNSELDQGGFSTLVNCDVHSKPGAVSCSKAMETALQTSQLPTCRITVPNGDVFFGAATFIYKCTPAGEVSLVHTNTQGPVIGMDFHLGYLYYATTTKLGRIALANASSEASWSSQNDSWATFTIGGAYKAMCRQNKSLFITDGKYIAAVDNAGAFSANVLDLEDHQIATSLCEYKTYLLIGTVSGSNADRAGIFLWDTWLPSWSEEDYIDEKGVNCFIKADNVILISAGTVGNIYYWTGASAERHPVIPTLQDNGTLVETSINPYASANLNGLPLFATKRGIYSFGTKRGEQFPSQVIEYTSTFGQGAIPGALAVSGSQVFFACQSPIGSTKRIDKLSDSYATAKLVTPLAVGKLNSAKVLYSSLPEGTSISLRMSKDGAGFTTEEVVNDSEELHYETKHHLCNKKFLKAEVSLVPDGTSKPEIYDILLT